MNRLYPRIATAILLCVGSFALVAQTAVVVDAPAGAAGTYLASPAAFGPAASGQTGPIVAPEPASGCDALTNDLTGSIAIVDFDGAICGVDVQALNVQAAGAIGMIICQDLAAVPFVFTADAPTVTIPVVALDQLSCDTIRMDLTGSSATLGAALEGYSCQTAIDITDGSYTAPAVDQGLASIFAGAENGLWYTYTAPQDGLMNVNSCNGGADTRLIVLPGATCNEVSASVDAGTFLFNDDACDLGDGDQFASEVSAFVSAGDEFHILWDDRWSSSGFDFTIGTSDSPILPVTFSVDVSDEDLMGQAVFVGGSFADTLFMLTDQGDGIYSGTLNIAGGNEVTYNYFIGDTAEPTDDLADCSIEDADGNLVRVVSVALDTINLDAVCFGLCTPCTIEVTDCADPFVFFDDGLEDYDVGTDPTGLTSWWETWAGSPGAVVTDTVGFGNSLEITQSVPNQDVVLAVGAKASGHYVVAFDMYVPEGNAAYFNFQHEMPLATSGFWAFDVFLNADATFDVEAYGGGTFAGTYPQGRFFPVTAVINIDEDVVTLYMNGALTGSWAWSNGTATGNAAYTSSLLYGVNFFPGLGGTDEYTYFIDNVTHYQIPEAGAGQYCYTAEPIEPGTITTPTLECFGGVDLDGWSGQWYTYTPAEDGRITLSSCDAGGDTRVWILEGDCGRYSVVGVNDDTDDCGPSGFSSLREAYVYADRTYYILWDARWESDAVTFDFEFTAEEGEPGRFCQTAIEITPGLYSIDNLSDISGNAAVTDQVLPNIDFSNSTNTSAAYSRTIWYAYTPESDGEVTATSCELTTEDTRLFVHTGTCENFDSLTLVAEVDEGCDGIDGPTSFTWDAVAGTTYYLEWDDAFLDNGFLWELQAAQAATVNVTFAVDVSLEDMPADTAFVIGAFVGWSDPIALEDQGDGLFVGTVAVPANDTFAFKFQNGRGNFEGGDFLADCGIEGGFGFDRLLITGDTDMTMDTVCFRYCVDCQTVDTDNPVFNNAFSVQPNPVDELVELTYSLPNTRKLRLTLTNTLGQTVRNVALGNVSTGTHRLDVADLSSGVYYLVLTDGTYTHSEKLIKR